MRPKEHSNLLVLYAISTAFHKNGQPLLIFLDAMTYNTSDGLQAANNSCTWTREIIFVPTLPHIINAAVVPYFNSSAETTKKAWKVQQWNSPLQTRPHLCLWPRNFTPPSLVLVGPSTQTQEWIKTKSCASLSIKPQ